MGKHAWSYISRSKCKKDFNKKAFHRIMIQPKHMVDSSYPNTEMKINFSNEVVTFPVGIAPTAVHNWVTPEGELATVRAAKRAGIIYIASQHASTTLEAIAAAEPTAMRWQQMYGTNEDDMLERAKQAGVTCIVLTIDRITNLKNPCREFSIQHYLNSRSALGNDTQVGYNNLVISFDDIMFPIHHLSCSPVLFVFTPIHNLF